jgi:hypothetical protein
MNSRVKVTTDTSCNPWPLFLTAMQAVALSNAACLAGAITNLMFNITRRNPVRPGPLIDYDLLLLVSVSFTICLPIFPHN